jgi:ADP-ribosylglycohydrolase
MYKRLFSPDFDKTPASEIKSTGYVVDTLEAAIWCVLTTDSYKECVLTAVNLGGDTDTVAAISGGLADASYGYDSIPKEWLESLLSRDYIEDMCDKAARGWTHNFAG